MNEKADRQAIAAALAWLMARPKTMLLIIGLLSGTGIVREGSRFLTGEVGKASVAIDDTRARIIVKEEVAPVLVAQAEVNRRLGNIESALMLRGLRADASNALPKPIEEP